MLPLQSTATGGQLKLLISLRACLYGEELSLGGGLPSIPNHPRQFTRGWRVTRFEGSVTLGYATFKASHPSNPGRANFSFKSLRDSTNRFYDPARVALGGETTRLGELSRLGR